MEKKNVPDRAEKLGETRKADFGQRPADRRQRGFADCRTAWPHRVAGPLDARKLAHFDREVIPERRMHAKGSGAYGTFTVTHDITRYTRASIFSRIGKQTECFVRFSTVGGNAVPPMPNATYAASR